MNRFSFSIIASLIFSLVVIHPAYATPSFGTNDLSVDGIISLPAIATSGTNVYVAGTDGFDLFVDVSTNNGGAFAPPTTPPSPSALDTSSPPQITATGSNVYVVWQNSTPDILFSRSTDSGANFAAATTLSGAGADTAPQIAATGTNVYVVWTDGSDILFSRSTDSGANFAASSNLSDPGGGTAPQIAATGTNVYVIWQEGGDIKIRISTDSGASFGGIINLSNNAGASSAARVVASGTNAYVTWRDLTPDANGDILFSAISNAGTISVDKTNLSSNTGTSNNPAITVDTNDVYVTWQDNITSGASNHEILFRHSSNSGAAFDGQINLSNTAPVSSLPHVSVSGNTVNIAWQDSVAGNGDILFRSSPDKGATFGGLLNLSADADTSQIPITSTTTTHTHVAWTSDGEVFIRSGATSSIDIKFDATQYNVGNTATITVTDSGANTNNAVQETINVAVSSTFPANIAQVTLTETAVDSGIFTAPLTLTASASSSSPCAASCNLQVASGNTIQTTYSGRTANAYMVATRIISFGFESYTLNDGRVTGSPVVVTLTDSAANTDSGTAQSVDATLTSTSQPGGITLRLTETGINTGIFRNTNLIFMTGSAQYSTTNTITISQLETDPLLNYGANNAQDTLSVTVRSTTNPGGFSMSLSETGQNTALFTGTLRFSTTGPSGGDTIQVSNGDIVSVTYAGATVNSQITPNPNPAVGAIQAAVGDTITVSYLGTTDTATIVSIPGGGGGGGGIVRPTVVVNVVAGIFAGGGGSSGGAASINSASLFTFSNPADGLGARLVDDTSLSDTSLPGTKPASSKSTKTVKTGEKLVLQLDITTNEGIDYMTHVELGLNNKGDPNRSSDTIITYDKYKPNQVTIVDPNKLFASADFKLLPKDARSGTLQFEITFAKPMETSDIRLLAWDIKRNFVHKIYEDAVKVERSDSQTTGSKQDTKPKTQEKINTEKLKKIVPQKLLKKEIQKEKLDKKAEKKQFDKLKKKMAKEKQQKKKLVSKLQNKYFKTMLKK